VPELERPEPPYLQIARRIRDQITSGQLADGDPVPSARQICADFGVAMSTATKALNQLKTEGLTRATRGLGTVVYTKRLHHSARDRSIAVLRTGRIYPPGHYAGNIQAELITAPDRVADALGVEPGTRVIRRQRVTYNQHDEPLSRSTSWFDGQLAAAAPALLESERIKQGTFRYVEQQTGRVRSLRERILFSAGFATEEEADLLGVPIGSPVLRGRNWYYDTDGGVIEYGESAAAPEVEANIEYTIEDNENESTE
jgi:DNA-binding GntR family transcriptional regulator